MVAGAKVISMSDVERPQRPQEVDYGAMSEADLMECVEQGLLGSNPELYAELMRRVAKQDQHYDASDPEARGRSQANVKAFMQRVGLPIPKGV